MRRINDVNPRNGNATSLANSQKPPFPHRTSPLSIFLFYRFHRLSSPAPCYPDPTHHDPTPEPFTIHDRTFTALSPTAFSRAYSRTCPYYSYFSRRTKIGSLPRFRSKPPLLSSPLEETQPWPRGDPFEKFESSLSSSVSLTVRCYYYYYYYLLGVVPARTVDPTHETRVSFRTGLKDITTGFF